MRWCRILDRRETKGANHHFIIGGVDFLGKSDADFVQRRLQIGVDESFDDDQTDAGRRQGRRRPPKPRLLLGFAGAEAKIGLRGPIEFGLRVAEVGFEAEMSVAGCQVGGEEESADDDSAGGRGSFKGGLED